MPDPRNLERVRAASVGDPKPGVAGGGGNIELKLDALRHCLVEAALRPDFDLAVAMLVLSAGAMTSTHMQLSGWKEAAKAAWLTAQTPADHAGFVPEGKVNFNALWNGDDGPLLDYHAKLVDLLQTYGIFPSAAWCMVLMQLAAEQLKHSECDEIKFIKLASGCWELNKEIDRRKSNLH